MHPVAILLIAIAVVIGLIIRFKINAFVALILAAILIGLLSPVVPLAAVMQEVTGRFGNVVGRVGIVILMASIIGQCLMQSGAADKITRRFVAMLGEKYSSLSMLSSSYVLGIPVFSDTVFYLLVPLARAMSIRMAGARYVLYSLAITAGSTATHIYVPPTPGPLAAAATLHVDMGVAILIGLMVAIPASLGCWLSGVWLDRKLNYKIREAPGLSLSELRKIADRPESELPGFRISMLPILLPVALITANTVGRNLIEDEGIRAFLAFVGDPNFALILAAAAAVALLATHKKLSLTETAKPVHEAITGSGMVILITAAGGAFGGMLERAEVGSVLGGYAQSLGMSLLVLGFLLSVLFKIAQGSGTVCMITVSSILAPLAAAQPPDYHIVYLMTAIGSGSVVGTWMNDSGFWVFSTMTGLSEMETLKTRTVGCAAMGFTGFFTTLLLAWLLPLQ